MAASGQRILVVGDSLSAEYGLKRGSGWVALLQQKLMRHGFHNPTRRVSIDTDIIRTMYISLLAQHS
jgi:acyl-CoA thioesterase-1